MDEFEQWTREREEGNHILMECASMVSKANVGFIGSAR